MKKSLIAAAFAAALPMSAMAQETTEPQEACVPISATAEFCAVVGTQPFIMPGPNGETLFGVPGSVNDGETTFDQCLYVVDPNQGPLGVECAPN